MFKKRKKRIYEYLVEIIENYTRMRLNQDKVIAGILADIENRLGGIDQSIIEVGLSQIDVFEMKNKKGVNQMIKGFVKPDGSILQSNMIVEGSNRTAAMMCYEMGLLIGVDEKDQPIICRNGNQVKVCVSFNLVDADIAQAIEDLNLQPAEVKSETSNDWEDVQAEEMNDEGSQAADQDQPGPVELHGLVHFEWYGKPLCVPDLAVVQMAGNMGLVTCGHCRKKFEQIGKGGLSSENPAENHPGAGVRPEN